MAASEVNSSSLKYPPGSPDEFETILKFIKTTPLAYGTWGPLKRLYKQVEGDSAGGAAVFGAVVARIDSLTPADATLANPTLHLSVRTGDALTAVGDFLYVKRGGRGNMGEIETFRLNPDDPLRPTAIGVETAGNCHTLLTSGYYVVSVVGSKVAGGLDIYGREASGALARRGQIDLGGPTRAADAYPYIAAAVSAGKFTGLKVISLMDPANPAVVSETEIKSIGQIAVDGPIAAVTTGKTGLSFTSLPSPGALRLIDIANPRKPRMLGSLNLGDAQAVALKDGIAAVIVFNGPSSRTAQLVTVDVRDPSRPARLGSVDVPTGATSVTLNGQFAYVIGNWSFMSIIDVRDPAKPVAAGRLDHTGTKAVALAGNRMFAASDYHGVALYDTTHPGKPARVGSPPSAATFAYMKRRARRYLRKLSKRDPDAYVQLCCECLAAMAAPISAKAGQALDMQNRWILADILYGGSDRYTQSRHGRGPLMRGDRSARAESSANGNTPVVNRMRFRRREERIPEFWDRHLHRVNTLLTLETLPWQVHEALFKIALPGGADLRDASNALLSRYLEGGSPLLAYYATRRVVERLHRGKVGADLVAAAYYKGSPTIRREIERDLPADISWGKKFAHHLLETVRVSGASSPRLSRRAVGACELMARRYPEHASPRTVLAMAPALLHALRPSLAELVYAAARLSTLADLKSWLALLDNASRDQQSGIVAGLVASVRGKTLVLPTALTLINSPSASIRSAAWELIEAAATDPAMLLQLWIPLLESRGPSDAVQTAMTSPSALSLLARAGIGPADLARRLAERPFLVAYLTTDTFEAMLRSAPVTVTLILVATATDAQWAEWRPHLLARLLDPAAAFEFWPSVDESLRADDTGMLAARLLEDPEIAATLQGVDNPALLDARDPAFDPHLERWAEAHEALFTANSPLMLQAATHGLPQLRTWALDRVRNLGQDLPFALRLLESQLPASVEVGMTFFESAAPGDPKEKTCALALCDSPFLTVRRIGEAYVTARWASLPQAELLQALFESFHPDTQAFVAQLLEKSTQVPELTARFDREVLRSRQKARVAKERVKARQSVEQSVDAETLLTLARGRTARDAEWALAELAKRAIAGDQIDGVAVDGAVG